MKQIANSLIILIFCFGILKATNLPESYFRLENRWKNECLHTEYGKVDIKKDAPFEWHSAMWILEKVSGTKYYRLKNRWKSQYLHVENGKPELMHNVPNGWLSAMWELESLPNSPYYRLKNRWKGEYLHLENGKPEIIANVPRGWLSAIWKLQDVIKGHNLNSSYNNLKGFIDMHAHPMSNYGFGNQLFHGKVDGEPRKSLGDCQCNHRGYDLFDNTCGNSIREGVAEAILKKYNVKSHDTKGSGYPGMISWPSNNSVLHQQMFVNWIKRAHEGGLVSMVALAVNNHTLADAAETNGFNDDLRVMNKQIDEMKRFVARHDFMQIAYSSNDFRRIVSSGKLAIILGTEMDNIGNFYNPADRKGGTYNPNPTMNEVKAEIDRLYSLGVRYILPIHVTNNVFGGASIYDAEFNVANKYNNGKPFEVESVSTSYTDIGYDLKAPADVTDEKGFILDFLFTFSGQPIPRHVMPYPENYPNYSNNHNKSTQGHRNKLGLTLIGHEAMTYLMEKGMMIDVDHMSERAVNTVLYSALSHDYPINSGHNSIRKNGGTEHSRTIQQLEMLFSLEGMFGLGHGDLAENFVVNFKEALDIANNKQVTIGTDVNGLYPLPGKPNNHVGVIDYNSNFTKYSYGDKKWDYNQEGMAHYGLFPDFIKSLENAGMNASEKNALFSSAEYFARMWEKCEVRSSEGLAYKPKCSKIKNRHTKNYIDVNQNSASLNSNFNNISEEGWELEPVLGSKRYYRIKSKKNGYYLHTEYGKLEVKQNVNKNWHSAMWELESATNQNGLRYVRLKSRYKDNYLHTENGRLELIQNVNQNWHSAMWIFESCIKPILE